MHGNWDAFAAVLNRVRRKRFDATLVLGDLVGESLEQLNVDTGDILLDGECRRFDCLGRFAPHKKQRYAAFLVQHLLEL